jgi:hypothetical protein
MTSRLYKEMLLNEAACCFVMVTHRVAKHSASTPSTHTRKLEYEATEGEW